MHSDGRRASAKVTCDNAVMFSLQRQMPLVCPYSINGSTVGTGTCLRGIEVCASVFFLKKETQKQPTYPDRTPASQEITHRKERKKERNSLEFSHQLFKAHPSLLLGNALLWTSTPHYTTKVTTRLTKSRTSTNGIDLRSCGWPHAIALRPK